MVVVGRVEGVDAWRFVREVVARTHRHLSPPAGWRWGLVATRRGVLVGVAVVGRAVGRWTDGRLEVTRLCTFGRRRHGAASALLRAAAVEAAAAGRRIVTYTLETESGRSLEAAGWERCGGSPARSRSCAARPRRTREDEAVGRHRWRPVDQLRADAVG